MGSLRSNVGARLQSDASSTWWLNLSEMVVDLHVWVRVWFRDLSLKPPGTAGEEDVDGCVLVVMLLGVVWRLFRVLFMMTHDHPTCFHGLLGLSSPKVRCPDLGSSCLMLTVSSDGDSSMSLSARIQPAVRCGSAFGIVVCCGEDIRRQSASPA